jgi:transcriptional regulator with XRE-family HTH domain
MPLCAQHRFFTLAPTTRTSDRTVSVRFGARLRYLRRQAGETQTCLADRLGIDRTFLSDVERGCTNISLSYLETLAQGFDLSLSEMMKDL